jgi:hypothetical protein
MRAQENSSSWFAINATGIEPPTPRESNCNVLAAIAHRPSRELASASVSHQKRPHRNATKAIETKSIDSLPLKTVCLQVSIPAASRTCKWVAGEWRAANGVLHQKRTILRAQAIQAKSPSACPK